MSPTTCVRGSPAAPTPARHRHHAAPHHSNQPYQPETHIAGWAHLCHKELFSESELAEMAAEAAKVIDEIRLPNRRKSLKGQRVAKPVNEINEQWFGLDADFFEAVMCDKFDFRKVQVTAVGRLL